MPPRISPSRLSQPQTCQCFRTRPREMRQFHASLRHATRLRRDMWAWIKGPGKAFRKPLPGATNYLSAYDKQGNLTRDNKEARQELRRSKERLAVREEEEAVRSELENESMTNDDRREARELRASERAIRDVEEQDNDERRGVPKERERDMRPYPLNQYFKSQPVLSEPLREQLYMQVAVYKHDLSSVAASFGVDIRRVAAVVRLKTIEKQWQEEGKTLAKPYNEAILRMLPTTPFRANSNSSITPHEPINDLPVHPSTRQQIFYPASESRQFTREDAAKVFSPTLLPADERIPIPMLVDIEKWNLQGLSRQQRLEKQVEADTKAAEAKESAETRRREWEERTQRVVKGRRWDFQFQDISAEKVGKDGRGRHAVGARYGMPHEDRKRGVVKIPTSVN